MDKNVEYYNINADSFVAGTIGADMAEDQNAFMALVPQGGWILDAGCGSGRDSKVFLESGYDVTAFDPSEEMRKRASKYLNHEVLDLRFQDMSFEGVFDGIWASASLLHVAMGELPEVMMRLHIALKPGGIIYASFKYGDGTKMRGERRFSDFNEKSVVPLFENAGFTIIEKKKGADSRPGREDEMWITVIARK